MLQKILYLIDEAKMAEAFEEIDKANLKSTSIAQLRREFIMGEKRFDFYDRLKMAVKNELKEEKPNDKPQTESIAGVNSWKVQFWIQFLLKAKERTDLFKSKDPKPENTARDGWMDISTGITSVSYTVSIRNDYARVCLYINKSMPESKIIFDKLYQSKAEIERLFGNALTWERKDNIQHSRIDYILDINTEKQENWDIVNDFLINNLIKFVQVLTPYLEKIKEANRGKEIRQEVVEEKFTPTLLINPPNGKVRILMLTANPAGTAKLNLDKEHSEIVSKLQSYLDRFSPLIKKAVNANEFKENTETIKPHILHFAGHGERVSEELKQLGVSESTNGIILQNDNKNGYEALTSEALEVLFEYFKDDKIQIQVVVLNACYSEEQASVIAKYVPFVIGTTKEVNNTHAIAFSTGFYFKVSSNDFDIEQAFKSGRTEAVMKGAKKTDFILFKAGQKLAM